MKRHERPSASGSGDAVSPASRSQPGAGWIWKGPEAVVDGEHPTFRALKKAQNQFSNTCGNR